MNLGLNETSKFDGYTIICGPGSPPPLPELLRRKFPTSQEKLEIAYEDAYERKRREIIERAERDAVRDHNKSKWNPFRKPQRRP